MSSPKRRIETDVMKMLMSDYEVSLVNDNMQEFYVRFRGPKETPFDGGLWKIHVELPDQYPYKSPSIGFVNRIFHPNIDEISGSVCLDVINQTWSPMFDMINIFEVFLPQLLRYPNPTDPLNGEAAALLMRDPKTYDAKVKDYVSKYATREAADEIGEDDGEDDEMSSVGSFDSDDEDPVANMEIPRAQLPPPARNTLGSRKAADLVKKSPALSIRREQTSSISSTPEHQSDPLSHLGDSSSLFSSDTRQSYSAEQPRAFYLPSGAGSTLLDKESPIDLCSSPTDRSGNQQYSPIRFGESNGTASSPFTFVFSPLTSMVVEREPPKATPQKPTRPALPRYQNAPEFGKPSPLQNRLQPNNNVFNIPKSQQSRPEHHRPSAKDVAHKVLDPLMHRQPPLPTSYTGYSDVVHIPQPLNPPIYNSYPKPPPTFSSVNGPTQPYGPSYAYKHEQPVVDLTKPQTFGASQPAFLDDRFSANDPYTYIDAEKANENIKNLLEGAFDDEEDKPRTRGRKKKIEAAVEGLANQLHSLEVKPEDKREEEQRVEAEEDEEEEFDDGTVEGLKVKLLPHQIDGVEWMREKENGATKKSKVLPRGGILADDMGLGKTIQSIALLLTNPRPSLTSATSATDKKTLSNTVGKGTLVVAPLALIKQWEAEIKDKVSDDQKMRVCVHHGPQRTKRFEDLKRYDVVITTYQILVSEHGSSSERDDGPKVGCFGLHWYRVILDEAHTIKNRNAKATQAAYNLKSEYRWCLTGTPMQNNLDELQSLIRFLRIKPYDNLAVWKDQITRPMSQGRGGVAIKRLQFYLKAFMKRRTKDVLKKEGALNPGGESDAKGGHATSGFKIMDRKVDAIVAEFSAEERRFYDRLEKRTDESLERMMDDQKMNYASALVLLLRLRQACNHPQLVGGNMAKDKDAITTDQGSGDRSPTKLKSQEDDVDEMAALLGGLSVETKQCEVCQKDLSEEETSSRMTRCAECEADFAGMGMAKKRSRKNHGSHRKGTDVKPASRKQRANKLVVEDSDDEEGEGEWIAPHGQHDMSNLGTAGGTDDENVEGGGESLLSNDTETGDDSEIKILGSRRKEVISLDTSDEESELKSESDPESDSSTASSSDEEEDLPTNREVSPTTSAKIRQLLTTLKLETPHHKTIVFSQFTSMLDLIEPHLRAGHLAFTRYDGSMRNDLREASLTRLRSDPKCRILLCSLKCGSLGLNLTAASRVVILEPFWNPFVEEQAIDRVHRINQTKDVVVYKLTVKNTVEERILALQEKKRALASAAIEGKEKVGKLSMKDILNLFKRDAEHDGNHDGDHGVDGLGAKMRVLGASNGADVVRDVEAVRRVTPPVVGGGGAGGARKGKEDPVFGRRW